MIKRIGKEMKKRGLKKINDSIRNLFDNLTLADIS